ncbi:UNVERIFIED_ORG: NAD(P)-dependent dehydrogenase (short-subunit alcohol dehydrogenase family) [Microbispora rosea subsp. rosea]
MNRFEGVRLLLTGAASGIGRATAVRLAAEGAHVFGVDRDERAVVAAVDAAAAALGGVDVLVNVAGIQRTTPIASLTVADLNLLFSVNLVGTALFCREALRHLPDRTGVIVNVASIAAAIAFAASSDGGYLTGANVRVDGGSGT